MRIIETLLLKGKRDYKFCHKKTIFPCEMPGHVASRMSSQDENLRMKPIADVRLLSDGMLPEDRDVLLPSNVRRVSWIASVKYRLLPRPCAKP